MKRIAELDAFSYGQIVSAVQIMRVMKRHGLDADDLMTIKKSMEKRMVSGIAKGRKKRP